MDSAYFTVKKEDVIDEGTITLWESEHVYPYLVYQNDSEAVLVNTSFEKNEIDDFVCCKYYTRRLADSIDSYKQLTKEQFEQTVYGAWMDGAR